MAKPISTDQHEAAARAAPSPFRLPDTITPVAYRLTIEPDFDTFTYSGVVEIDFNVCAPVKEVVLNAADLNIAGASLQGIPAGISLDQNAERLTITADRPLEAGAGSLTVRYSGTISETLRGFYRSSYVAVDGSRRWLAATQFEATNARRAFPCFDEPAFKATFELTIVVPQDRTAISNMQAARRDGRRLTFAPTPVMSSYLLMFAIGEFETIEAATTNGVPVRVHTVPGSTAFGRFALDVAVKGLAWFDAYYSIPYAQSVPKLDLVALPDFEAGGMENWGAITFREAAIFVDPETSSIPQRRHVAQAVLHELAHQWFGTLVTPEWWSYLWLNESFATFMAFKAMDALFPEWKVWEEYGRDRRDSADRAFCLRHVARARRGGNRQPEGRKSTGKSPEARSSSFAPTGRRLGPIGHSRA